MTDPGRQPDLRSLSTAELHRTRRDLTISLALTRPGAPAAITAAAHLRAIDAELARRTASPPADR